jgi:hypothetical protein
LFCEITSPVFAIGQFNEFLIAQFLHGRLAEIAFKIAPSGGSTMASHRLA